MEKNLLLFDRPSPSLPTYVAGGDPEAGDVTRGEVDEAPPDWSRVSHDFLRCCCCSSDSMDDVIAPLSLCCDVSRLVSLSDKSAGFFRRYLITSRDTCHKSGQVRSGRVT